MFLVGICEDDLRERNFLQEKVTRWFAQEGPQFKIMTFAAGEELLECKETFDLIFLDVDMGNPWRMDGIEVGRVIRRSNKKAKLIYVTGYDDYQGKAMALHCFQYLVKPVREETIFQQLREALEYEEKPLLHILLDTEDGVVKASVANIYYFHYYERQRIRVVMRTGEHILRGSLADIVEKTNGFPFYFAHQNYFVNLANVAKVCAEKVFLTGGGAVPLAGRRAKIFRETFYDYLFDKIGEDMK